MKTIKIINNRHHNLSIAPLHPNRKDIHLSPHQNNSHAIPHDLSCSDFTLLKSQTKYLKTHHYQTTPSPPNFR